MAIYTVSISSAGSPDIVSLTDGSTYATLEVSAGKGPRGAGFTGGSYDSSSGVISFTSNDGIGFSTSDIRPEITAAVAAAEAAQSGAETAEAGAEAAQAATESIFDQFGDQYLGPKASDPTVDNDGDPLTAGDIYFNTTDSVLKFYSGSAWVAPESIATTAASDAQAAQAASETAEANAETAQTAAEAAQAGAETAETNASASETAAAGSAAAASTSADEAAASAASINLNSIDINGGTIDGTVIGGTTPAAGSFTTGSFTGDVAYGDNVKATFGASSDLRIYHNGSNSYIDDTGVGSLFIRSDDIRINKYTGEFMLRAEADGPVELYYDNAQKLATTSTGIDVTGTVTADGLTVDGTTQLNSGATDEVLRLEGTGSPYMSWYDSGVRQAYIGSFGNTFDIIGDTPDTQVKISTGGVSRASFNSTGVDVTGTVTADGLTVDAGSGTSVTSTGNNIQFDRDAGFSFIDQIGTGGIRLRTTASYTNRMDIANNGDISFYDDSNNAKFFWDASNESLGIGNTSPSSTYAVDSAKPFRIIAPSPNVNFVESDASNQTWAAGSYGGTFAVRDITGSGYPLQIEAGTSSNTLYLDSSGNVKIGDASTDITSKLVVSGNGSSNVATFMYDGNAGTFLDIDANAANGAVTLSADARSGSYPPLTFKTGNTERMRINSSGFVGINETSPATELDVNGTTTSNQYLLDNIAKDISDTAVDVFVYDTSKDSDGGAWRKRTQGTSWYNETLNTATRGSRKEFPAVAVIVAESSQVTIYDGDDPDLPMWMVFNLGSSYMINLAGTTRQIKAVQFLNGIMVVPLNGGVNNGTTIVKFIEDFGYEIGAGYQRYGVQNAKIADRNVNATTFPQLSSVGIVSGNSNDIAMTVLPNAPIDAATGLPVPTIAVATDGGVSVIKDDGTVADSSSTSSFTQVDFEEDGSLWVYRGSTGGTEVITSYASDGFTANNAYTTSSTPAIISSGTVKVISGYRGTGSGLNVIDDDATTQANGMIAYTASDYATGWLNGDIKLATLSDTDATNVTGSELVTSWVNGTTYAYDTFTASGASITSAITDGSDFAGAASNAITVTSGKHYVISFNLTLNSGNAPQVYFVNSQNGGAASQSNQAVSVSGNNSITLIPTTTGTVYLQLRHQNGVAGNFATGDVSLRLAEEDRSVNGNGLQVFGTVTKSAVASGADLVAYSGFSASNYLEAPYNADLEVGTGDISFMGWVKKGSSTGYQIILQRDKSGDNVGTGSFEMAILNTTGQVLAQTYDGAAQTATSTSAVSADTWSFICGVIDAGVLKIYFNGVLEDTVTPTALSTSGEDVLTFGIRTNHSSNPMTTGSLALFRISATAPTAAQIKKIYEDEKVLFQDGAQATLYGSSDAVTALAYDDSTNILSVGTSAGRSDFQGLRRVNNTTNAVGAAISASNGMIVEE